MIRLLAASDRLQFCTLLQQLTVINPAAISDSQFQARIGLIEQNQFHHVYVWEENGQVVATASLFIEPKFIHDLSYVGHIEDVVVDQSMRGQGIGNQLVQHALSVAREAGCYKVILNCSEKNVEFYRKAGMEPKGVQMGYVF